MAFERRGGLTLSPPPKKTFPRPEGRTWAVLDRSAGLLRPGSGMKFIQPSVQFSGQSRHPAAGQFDHGQTVLFSPSPGRLPVNIQVDGDIFPAGQPAGGYAQSFFPLDGGGFRPCFSSWASSHSISMRRTKLDKGRWSALAYCSNFALSSSGIRTAINSMTPL